MKRCFLYNHEKYNTSTWNWINERGTPSFSLTNRLFNFYYLRETYGSFSVTFNRAEQWRFFRNNLLYDILRMKWFNPWFSPAVQRLSAVNSSSSTESTRALNEPQNYDIVSSIVSLFVSCVSRFKQSCGCFEFANFNDYATWKVLTARVEALNWISSYRAFRGAASYSAFTSKT